jgi:peptide/nickel transport system substrate-binding protein
MILDCAESNTCSGQIQDYNSFNPFLPGATSRIGWNWLYEPLYFYLAYQPEQRSLVPWIATGHKYNESYTEATIHIRRGVTWSDGEPWTAHDVVYTVEMLRTHAPELTFSTDMQTWVDEVVAVDSYTIHFKLTGANPRFVFSGRQP